ncbi:MAG: LysM peptidoglycan-binding domain-containing protein [Planctomycetota bacterium]|jgi:nucleoid-associated protein YgaU
MKISYAWMLILFLIPTLMTGCQETQEEAITQAPTQEEPLETFPEDQVPVAEPQSAASPPVDTSVPIAGETPKTTVRKSKPAPKESYAPPKKKNVRYYVVKKGDTLQKISRKFYGTTKKWRAIYKANRKTMKKGPDKIQIGTKLVIP